MHFSVAPSILICKGFEGVLMLNLKFYTHKNPSLNRTQNAKSARTLVFWYNKMSSQSTKILITSLQPVKMVSNQLDQKEIMVLGYVELMEKGFSVLRDFKTHS